MTGSACNVTWVSYAGDEGGVICQLDAGANASAAFASLTHLGLDPRLPPARDILAYQKHRLKRLRRQPQWRRVGTSTQSQAGSAVAPPRRLPFNAARLVRERWMGRQANTGTVRHVQPRVAAKTTAEHRIKTDFTLKAHPLPIDGAQKLIVCGELREEARCPRAAPS